MKCEYELCIYQKDGLCTVGNVGIDMLGACDSAEYVIIPPDDLRRYKEQNLERLEQQWQEHLKLLHQDRLERQWQDHLNHLRTSEQEMERDYD